MIKLFYIVSLLFLMLVEAHAFKQEKHVSYSVSYFLDTANVYSLEDVLVNKKIVFSPVSKPADINFGYSNTAVWLKVKLNEPTKGLDYVMSIENAHIDSICFYSFYKQGAFNKVQTGDHFLFKSRTYEYNMFAFTLPDSCDYFMLKIKSEGVLLIPLSVNSVKEHIQQSNATIFLFSLFFGFLLLALLINTLVYIRVIESIYLYYVLCLLGMGVANATDFGFLFQFIWPNHPVLNHYVVVFYAFNIFTTVFSQQILSLKKNSKVLNYIFTVCIYIMGLAVLLNLMGYYHFVIHYLNYYFYFILLLYLFSGFYIYFIKKYRPALFYMLAWSAYAIFAMIYIYGIGLSVITLLLKMP